MGRLYGFVFCFLVISGSTLCVQGFIYSTPDAALRFSQCLIEKMGESQLFSEDDRNSMIEVANVMAQAFQNQRRLSPKILLTAFMTSMADVISHQDIVKSTGRRGFYVAALEQCSLLSIGYIDREFIDESMTILSTIENSKLSKFAGAFPYQRSEAGAVDAYGSVVNIGRPNIFAPLSVQPSPVQSPPIPEFFNPNVRSFGGPNISPDFHPIESGLNSGTNPQFQFQSASNTGIYSGVSFGGISQIKTDSAALPSSEFPRGSDFSYTGETSQGASAFGGLNVPQTRESSVLVIPPAGNVPSGQNNPLPNPPQETGEVLFKPASEAEAPLPPAFTSQLGVQDQDRPSDSSLENDFVNTLIQSDDFRKAFNFDTPKIDAMNLARTIMGKTFESFDITIVNQILTAVTDEIGKISIGRPDSYASALSNVLVSVMKLHNLPLFVNGTPIISVLLSNLQNVQQFPPQVENQRSDADFNPEQSEKPVDYYFEAPPLAPEDRGGEIFSEVLTRYLMESKELSDFFCSTDSTDNRVQIYSIIKASLLAYNLQVSSLAAGMTSGALSELSKQELCSKYAKTIAEVIAEVLDENRVLEGANAENISKQMAFSLRQHWIKPESQDTGSSEMKPPQSDTTNVPYNKTPAIQPSFSGDSTSGFDQSSVDKIPSSEDIKHDAGTALQAFSTPIISIQTSPGNYSIPVTTPYTIEITDEDITNAMTWMTLLTEVTNSPPTESAFDWSPSGDFDQEELASHLLEELESALDAYYDRATDDSSTPTNQTHTTVEAVLGSAQSDTLTSTSQQTKKKGHRTSSHGNANRNSRRQGGSHALNVPEDTSIKAGPVELQPSFQGPQIPEYPPSSKSVDAVRQEMLTAVARNVSQIAISSIAFIRSGNFDINVLCARINEFAPIVDIPPLDYCQEVAAIDYLLNVLKTVIKMLDEDV